MPRRKVFYSTEDLAGHRKKMSDYQRQWRLPKKNCIKCKQEFPNNAQYFARNLSGWITKTCINCMEIVRKERIAQNDPHPRPGVCPLCREPAHLVRHMQAPQVVWVCRGCVATMNRIRDLGTLDRLYEYMPWAFGWSVIPPNKNPPPEDFSKDGPSTGSGDGQVQRGAS